MKTLKNSNFFLINKNYNKIYLKIQFNYPFLKSNSKTTYTSTLINFILGNRS